jgi:selenide,water dikinase
MVSHPDLLVGNDTGDDAAVYRLDDKTAIIVTVDFFTPITDDPYEFGVIAAANSLSDVYAMGGKPLVALNVVGFPANLAVEMLGDVLKGGYDKATEAGCLIVGGHTVDDEEPKYGLSVVGLIEPGKEVSNANAQPGDVLVLTKPIGTGIITTGCKQGITPDDILKQAVDTMAELNKGASEAMMKVGVNSCTDITGFGLMGHLRGMVRGSGTGAKIKVADVPVLAGVWDLLEKGTVPGGTFRNMSSVADSVDWDPSLTEEQRLLMCDAQTSGGLLISVPEGKVDLLLSELESFGVETRAIVGEITAENPGRISVSP